MPPIRILELRSVRGTGGGPEKTILLGAAQSDPARYKVTVCYVRDARDDVFGIDRRAAALGVDYVELRERHSLDIGVWAQFKDLIREKQIDIVHSHDYKTDLLAAAAMKTGRTTAIATAHGWTGLSAKERFIYYPGGKRLLRYFPRVIAVSNDIRREILRHGARPDRVITVLNGINHLAFKRDRHRESLVRQSLGLATGDVVIGAVGRLEQQKRFDLLIDAAARLRERWPTLKVVIVGDGSLHASLTAQVHAQGLEGRCLILGHRDDVADVHHAFDLFVQASDYEGTPNAVLEAMALETPVVATDAGGTRDIVRDGVDGIVIDKGDAGVIAEAISAALADRVALAQRAVSARSQVETDLSFQSRMAKVERLYSELFAEWTATGGRRTVHRLATRP